MFHFTIYVDLLYIGYIEYFASSRHVGRGTLISDTG